jgi:hypothetical protein
MGRLSLVVCLPPEAGSDLRDALIDALAPFALLQGHPAERDLVADWRFDGGSNGRGFHHVPLSTDDPRLIHDESWDGQHMPSLPGMCAGGPRALLDITKSSERAAQGAGRAWDLWQRLANAHPAPRPHLAFSDAGSPLTVYTGPNLEYLAQPLVEAFLSADEEAAVGAVVDLPWLDPVVELSFRREDVITRAYERAQPQHHLLTADGWWVWPECGPVHADFDGSGGPHARQAPAVVTHADLAHYLVNQPADALLVRLSCRI